MRLFLAVHLERRFVETLTTRLDPVRADLALAWTRPGSWHLTLHFLGEWPENRVSRLQAALKMAVDQTEFEVTPGRLGAFPDLHRPRVLFLHMSGDGHLAKLAAAVRETVNRTWPDGPQDNKPFQSHLTLARVRRHLASGDAKSLSNIDLGVFWPFPINGFSLMASKLSRGGARHEKVAFYPLRKKGE